MATTDEIRVIREEVRRTRDGCAFRWREWGGGWPADRIALASALDDSPVYNGRYNSGCAACYFGRGHSQAAHFAGGGAIHS